MPAQRTSPALVDRILQLSSASPVSSTVIADRLLLVPRTVRNVLRKARLHHSPYARSSPGRPTLLSRAEVEGIRRWTDVESATSLRTVAVFVALAYDKTIALPTLAHIMARARITVKKPEKRPIERDEAQRSVFIARMAALNMDCVTFVDECAFTRYTSVPRRAWATANRPAVVSVRKRGRGFRHITLLMAVNTSGVVAAMLIYGGATGQHFEYFLTHCIVPRRNPATGQNSIVVLDNARIHRNRGMIQRVQQRGVQLFFLPPYSPDLDPIEEVFSPLKTDVRAHDEQYVAAPEATVIAAIRRITPAACRNTINSMVYARR
jgi:transposase